MPLIALSTVLFQPRNHEIGSNRPMTRYSNHPIIGVDSRNARILVVLHTLLLILPRWSTFPQHRCMHRPKPSLLAVWSLDTLARCSCTHIIACQ